MKNDNNSKNVPKKAKNKGDINSNGKPLYKVPKQDNFQQNVVLLTGKNLTEIFVQIPNLAQNMLPLVYLDTLENWSIVELAQFCSQTKGRVMLGYRIPKEGGLKDIGDTTNSLEHRQIWKAILQMGFEYLHIGLATCLLGVKKIKPNVVLKPKKKKKGAEPEIEPSYYFDLNDKHPQTKIVIGYQNNLTSPSYRQLRQIQRRMAGFNPDFTLFELNLKQSHHYLHLLRLILSKKKNEQILVSAVGYNATKVNLIAGLVGNPLVFVDNLETGQNLDKIMELL